MEQTFARILLLLSFSAAFTKYIHISKKMTWHEAQEYCRLNHTDLAPVSSTYDTERLRLAGDNNYYMWIGLRRTCTDYNKWTWSGGGRVSTSLWANGQPNNLTHEYYGVIINYKWHDATAAFKAAFFCYNPVVVRQEKTWEGALEYCREHHHDLASVASDTEMMLIQKKLNNTEATARFWIGLRFFPGGWLWVDRQPLGYEAWGQEGKLECPDFKRRCAALRVTGETQGDSAKVSPLVIDPKWETMVRDVYGTCRVNAASQNIDEVSNIKVGEWEARDCVERRYFICY